MTVTRYDVRFMREIYRTNSDKSKTLLFVSYLTVDFYHRGGEPSIEDLLQLTTLPGWKSIRIEKVDV